MTCVSNVTRCVHGQRSVEKARCLFNRLSQEAPHSSCSHPLSRNKSHATSRCEEGLGGEGGKCSRAGQPFLLTALHSGKGAQIPAGQLCLPHVPWHFCVPSLLPENWVHLLVGVKPVDTTKPKSGRKKDLLLLKESKENTGGPSKSSVSLNSKTEEFLG